MFDFFGVGESLRNAFTSMNELVNPIWSDIRLMLFGTGFNPFEPSTSLVMVFLFFYLFIVVITGSSFILSNLRELSQKQVFKKAILIIIFLVIGSVIGVRIESQDNLKPFNLSLVYIKDDNASDDATIKNNRGYVTISNESKFNAQKVFSKDDGQNQYITFSPKDGFASSNLSTPYQSEKGYQKFIVGINPVYIPYKSFTPKNTVFSNLDLLGVNYSGIDKNAMDDLANLRNTHKFEGGRFQSFFEILYGNYNTDVSKREVMGKEGETKSSKNPFYKGKEYIFAGQYFDSKYPYKSDLIFKNQNEKNQVEYMTIPYYDIVSFVNPNLDLDTGVSSLLAKEAFSEEDDDGVEEVVEGVSKEQKVKYQLLQTEIKSKLSDVNEINIAKIQEASTNFVTDEANPESFGQKINGIDDQKVQLIMNYNVTNNKNKYELDFIKENTKTNIKSIVKLLDKYIEQAGQLKEEKQKLQTSPSDTTIAGKVKKLENSLGTIITTVSDLYSTMVDVNKYGKTEQVNVLSALNISGGAPTLQQVRDIQNSVDNINNATKVKSSLESTLVNLTQAQSILNDKEKTLLDVVESIEKWEKESGGIKVMNTKNEPLLTVYAFMIEGKGNKFQTTSAEQLIAAFCQGGEKIETVFEKLRKQGFVIDDTMINCSFNSGEGQIVNEKKLKETLFEAMFFDIQTKFLSEKVNIIPYLASIDDKDGNLLSSIYSSGDQTKIQDEFLTNRIKFGDYAFVSPLVYYNALLNNQPDNIPGIFINLIPIEGKVYTPAKTYNMKIGEVDSWYASLDAINGYKYSQSLNWGSIPLAHNLVLGLMLLITTVSYLCIFLFLYQIYSTLLVHKN